MKLSDGVYGVAGDFNWFGVPKTVYLIRGGKKEKFDFKLLEKGLSKEPTLRPWDIIYFPETMF